jgi:Putative metallopeptidase
MKRLKAVAAALALAAGVASGPADAAADRGGHEEEVQIFVLGNTIFTLYHELGHALVHLLDLPVLGREEDAVDNLATVLMLPRHPDPLMDRLVMAAADGWYMSGTLQEEDEPAWWDEHALDLQRYHTLVCLIYGSDPEGFAGLAEAVELPADKRGQCPEAYDRALASWTKVLSPHHNPAAGPAAGPATGPGGLERPSAITVRYGTPGPEYAHLAALLKEAGVAEAIAQDMGTTFRLPGQVELRFERCGTENAFYDQEKRSVTFCYELMAFFETLILTDIGRR